MPQVKISYVVSFSSEDKVHVANNLLGDKPSLKWKCKSVGELSAVVIFQLEKASIISGIDIGNEYSAYLEILVSRSGGNEDYKTLLITTPFMSAFESKEGQNMNRVKMFKKDDLSEPERNEKWDRIKIVCGQPFNKHVQFGLSFIKIHTSETDKTAGKEMFGKFTIRPESPNDLTRGTLFAKKKEPVEQKPQSAAAAIRDIEYKIFNKQDLTPITKLTPSLKPSTSKTSDYVNLDTPKPRHRKELFYTDDDEKPNAKIDLYFEKKNAEKKKLQDKLSKHEETETPKRKAKNEPEKAKKEPEKAKKEPEKPNKEKKDKKVESGNVSLKRKIDDNAVSSAKKIKQGISKPFRKLLEDVVLVISGIQNPDRASLRGKIMEMGAKYKSDWDATCTHLVCAYMNTPKFNQVKGKGKIVTRKWIEECYSQRKRIPWRQFALDKQERGKVESEDEIIEEIERIQEITPEPDYDDTMEAASDTEERVQAKLNEVKNEETNVYTVETDSEEDERKRMKNKPFDFFKNKTFFIDHNLEDIVEEMLKNYIFIHEGSLQDDLVENIDYIICGRDEAKNLNDVNSGGICLLPDWVVDCHKCRQFIPPDEYFIL